MMCPFCKSENHVVYANKRYERSEEATVRYRKCNNCGQTFKTVETYSKKTLEEVENEKRNAI